MKKQIGILLASSFLMSVPVSYATAQENAQDNAAPVQPMQVATDVDSLIDLPSNHWAYRAVKLLVEELEVMEPKTSNMFKGNDLMTRYELADVFYNVVKKLENETGKDLKRLGNAPDTVMPDVDAANATAVNSVVNEYGIMQAMPGKKFMGNEPISRYEIAFELYNYFTLIESQGYSPALARIDRSSQLQDLPADHWATKAVKAIVDKYQVMTGYPDFTFKGAKRLTRYEAAATIREFIRYVDTYLIPLLVEPTPIPTPVPTPVPTVMPTPEPTPEPKVPHSTFDLRLGGDYRLANGSWSENFADTSKLMSNGMYGGNGALDVWFPQMGWTRFGLDLHGDYQMYAQPSGYTEHPNLNRLTAGGGLLWKLLGAESDQDVALTIGAGYDYMMLMGSQQGPNDTESRPYSYANHGPRGRINLEIPVGPYFSIVGNNAFTYFIGGTAAAPDDIMWKNDAFVGVNIPAYTLFTFELGYRDTRYVKENDMSRILGDAGAEANLRFRF